jgi:hypothetical protein
MLRLRIGFRAVGHAAAAGGGGPMITATPPDDEILVIPCGRHDGLFYLSVDDFADPNEIEITNEQIHLTGVELGGPDVPFCFSLSVTSAVKLVAELNAAIAKRGGVSS